MSRDDWLLDPVTAKILRTLVENPTTSYNKTQLIEAADVSRGAFYTRFEDLRNSRLIEPANVTSGRHYWTFNDDAELADAIVTLLNSTGDTQLQSTK